VLRRLVSVGKVNLFPLTVSNLLNNDKLEMEGETAPGKSVCRQPAMRVSPPPPNQLMEATSFVTLMSICDLILLIAFPFLF
jgi:hypothetical protein